jgi:hypothetical protein
MKANAIKLTARELMITLLSGMPAPHWIPTVTVTYWTYSFDNVKTLEGATAW